MIQKKSAQVIVIGGGIIGTSIVFALSKKGITSILLERDCLAAGTAGATDGYITYHTKKPGIHLQMGMMSGDMFEPLSEEIKELTGIDIEYMKNCGSMQVLDQESEWPFIEEMVKQQHESTGLDIAMYPIQELCRIEPALNPKLIGGLYSPTAGKVNPIYMVVGLANAAKHNGATVVEGCNVTGISVEDGAIKGVHTSNGDYYADFVVDAAGTWSAQIAHMIGLELPIKPRRGQILVTEPIAPLIKSTMQCGRTTAIKLNPKMLECLDPKIVEMGMGFCIEQTQDGSMLIGFTREFVGFDRRTTLDAIELISTRAAYYIPALCNVNIIRTFSGLRPYTPDGLPVLGFVDEMKGFVMAAGHEGDGICLAPLTGKLIAELIAGEDLSFPILPFSYKRFVEQ